MPARPAEAEQKHEFYSPLCELYTFNAAADYGAGRLVRKLVQLGGDESILAIEL